jgi:hypothetical protein
MSRSGYSDDLDTLDLGRWRGQVASALRGKRGQKFLRDLITALDALTEKQLITDELEGADGVCALGALGRLRGIALDRVDTYDAEDLGAMFDIASQLAQEVMFVNDEQCYGLTAEERWHQIRRWAERHLAPAKAAP